jgi:uncharacterized membrane protein
MSRVFLSPFSLLFLVALVLIGILLIPLLFLNIIGSAFTRLGFSGWQAVLIVLLTLVGSFVNIPVTTIQSAPLFPSGQSFGGRGSRFLPFFYRVPVYTEMTTVAVNLGGAVVPVVISLLLSWAAVAVVGTGLLLQIGIGIVAVTIVTHLLAEPVPGLGISTPFFIPPITAALAGLLLAGGIGWESAVIAYIGGTIGTLIGADLLNWRSYGNLGAPLVSIGGAGTFDGIFLAGVLAVLLA